MAVFALVLLVTLIFLLTGSRNIFARRAVIHTYLNDSAAMQIGSSVRLNGILIGNVSGVTLTGSREPGRIVRIDLQVEERLLKDIPVDSLVTMSAENVLGAKFINIRKGTSPTTVVPGGELKAREDQDFLEIVQSAQPILESMRVTVRRIDDIVELVEAGRGTIGKLLVDEELYDRINAIARDAQTVTSTLAAGKGTVGKLMYDEALYDDVRASVARLDRLVAGLEKGQGTAGKLLQDPALYNETHKTISELRQLAADLNAGQGTAGRLLKSDELHNQLAGTLARVDLTIDKLNAGQGTLGQLIVNPQLYDSVNMATREMNALLKDFRANPKKFLRIRVSLF